MPGQADERSSSVPAQLDRASTTMRAPARATRLRRPEQPFDKVPRAFNGFHWQRNECESHHQPTGDVSSLASGVGAAGLTGLSVSQFQHIPKLSGTGSPQEWHCHPGPSSLSPVCMAVWIASFADQIITSAIPRANLTDWPFRAAPHNVSARKMLSTNSSRRRASSSRGRLLASSMPRF